MTCVGRTALPLALKTVVILINNNGHQDSRLPAPKLRFKCSGEQRFQNYSRRAVEIRQPRPGFGREDGNHHNLFRQEHSQCNNINAGRGRTLRLQKVRQKICEGQNASSHLLPQGAA